MASSDTLLKEIAVSSNINLGEETTLLGSNISPKPDVLNECKLFIEAEDGGNTKNKIYSEKSIESKTDDEGQMLRIKAKLEKLKYPATSTPDNKESASENLVADSNPECDIEGLPDLPSDEGLPSTVTILDAPDGGKVYLIGTAHFSIPSQEDVAKVIQEVNPHMVMIELCEQRSNILLLDEDTLHRELKNMNLKKIRSIIRENGVVKGLMYILMLNLSLEASKDLGMPPGGEFRRAYAEARKIPNCMIHLGDRAIDVTLQRAFSSLSWMQTIRFAWKLMFSDNSLSAEEVEKCKQKKMLDEMMEEMGENFPSLKEVFVVERDIYLCHSLQVAALLPRPEPCRVVGVVGMGHVAGIVEKWGKVRPEQIPPLLILPPTSTSTKVLRVTIRVSLAAGLLFAAYKFMPRRLIPF